MVVYGEVLFLENFIIGGVILYLTAEVCRSRKPPLWKWRCRLLAGAMLCGCFSMVMFLPIGSLMTAALEAGFACVLSALVYGRRRAWRKALVFLLLTYCMGGMIMGLLLLMQNRALCTPAGIYTGQMRAGMLALLMGAASLTVMYAAKAIRRRKLQVAHVAAVSIQAAGQTLETRGYCDTGNSLKDPLTGNSVAVADAALWKRMAACGMLEEKRMRLIPCQTVAGTELLQAVKVDVLLVRERSVDSIVIARGPEQFVIREMMEAACELLLPKEMTEGVFSEAEGGKE